MLSNMQVQQTSANPASPRSRQITNGLSTLSLRTLKGQFILHAGLILLLAAILTLVSSTTLNRASSDLATIDSGSIPSVNYAQSITQDIETIDAQSADYLATAGLTSTRPCQIAYLNITNVLSNHICDERDIDAEIVHVNQTLFQAAHNVTYPGEQTAVERITIGLESYLDNIHQMRVDFGLAANKTDASDPYLKQAYQAYLTASAILHNHISLDTIGAGQIPLNKEANLPDCTLTTSQTLSPDEWTRGGLTTALDCLSSINYSHLQGAFNDSSHSLGSSTAWVFILSLLLGLLLVLGTGHMVVRSHRYINPGLLIATLLCVIVSTITISLLGSLQGIGSTHSQDGAFVQLVQDDYASVYYAAVLERVATDANADESRWLIAQEFHDTASIDHWQTDWDQHVQQIQHLIQQAQTNKTWNTEEQPLSDMQSYWNRYMSIDRQIRTLATNQKDPKRLLTAETISTGPSNQTFTSLNIAISQLAQANQDQYNQTFVGVNHSLMLSFVLSLIIFPLTGLLALWGIAIRLKDF